MNKKALIVGGNSGIGLSISCELLRSGYDYIYIVGKEPINHSEIPADIKELFSNKTEFHLLNLINEDYSLFKTIRDINTLIITVGFGRVSLFENLTDREVSCLLKVNFDSVINIIKNYYGLIKSSDDFYSAVLVSICGRIVSPFFSVYGAAKGGIRFFLENLNCELSSGGFSNRILEVSPGSIKGTNFSGGGTNLTILTDLTKNILKRMFERQTVYIPQYDSTYKKVIERYIQNPDKFGGESYRYKLESGRLTNKPQVVVGFLSGTFDLFHIGHLNLLKRAKEQCDYLIVSVHNSGAWKGKETFIPYDERKAIVESIKYVDEVVEDFSEDSDAWNKYHYDLLFVGSDYQGTERFIRYEQLLKGKARIVYFPYTKGTSSTELRKALSKK